jgi:hypothetical protein
MFSRSTDGGLTWSTAKRINDDPVGQTHYHWFGTLSVAPNGRIDVVWNDSRADSTNTRSALYYSSSFDGGVTWTTNVRLTPDFDPHLGYPNQNKMGDYLGMVSDVGGANVAYAATFNGEEDVYYLRIPGPVRYSLNADSIALFEGVNPTGTVSDVWTVDGHTFNVGTTGLPDFSQGGAVVVDFTAPLDAVNDLWVQTETQAPDQTLQSVLIYNWGTQQYDTIGTARILTGQTGFSYPLFGDPTPYIGPNRKVRVVVRGLYVTGSRQGSRAVLKFDMIKLLMN